MTARLTRRELLAVLAGGAGLVALGCQPAPPLLNEPTATTTSTTPPATPVVRPVGARNVTFSYNMQDFAYPERSAAILGRVLDLHTSLDLPCDVYLTDPLLRLYDSTLLQRLRDDPLVAVSWHVRPPAPYYNGYDWLGLAELTRSEQEAVVRDYETHATDQVTGQPTGTAGGYTACRDLLGYAPFSAGALSDRPVVDAVESVFADLGATFTIVHGTATDLGTQRASGLYTKPEHHDLMLFLQVGRSPAEIVDEASTAAAVAAEGEPSFIGVKMHDNDWFAEESAWVTTYSKRTRRPPWDLSVRSPLLPAGDQDAMWTTYEATVLEIASRRDGGTLEVVNLRDVAAALGA